MIRGNMKNFDFQNELKKIINGKQIIEVDLNHNSHELSHVKGYIVDTNDDYLIIARITNDLTLDGVTIYRMEDVESIQVETSFLKELNKGIVDDSLYQEAVEYTKDVKKISFRDFITAFEGSKTLIDVTTESGSHTGRVFAHDEKILVIDEYYVEDDGRFARSYINPKVITSITVGGAWLKIIQRSLADKKI